MSLFILTFDCYSNSLWHWSCNIPKREHQSAGIDATVFIFHPGNGELGSIRVGIPIHSIQYGFTTLDKKKYIKVNLFIITKHENKITAKSGN